MTVVEDIKGEISRVNAALTNIAADIRRLSDAIPPTGPISDTDAQELKESLKLMADRAEAIAAVTPEEPNAEPVTDSTPGGFTGEANQG